MDIKRPYGSFYRTVKMKLKYIISIAVFILFTSNVYTQVFGDTVQVRFNEWMDTTGFINANNFVWNNGLVTLDVYLADTALAILTVSEPQINVLYTVEVFNVYDLAMNLINPEKDTTSRRWTVVSVEQELIDSTATEKFAIYPNPTRFNFKIIINDDNQNKIVKIYTILGELVKTFTTSDQTIYVNDRLSTGVYLVIYHNKEENTTNIIKLMILK